MSVHRNTILSTYHGQLISLKIVTLIAREAVAGVDMATQQVTEMSQTRRTAVVVVNLMMAIVLLSQR